MARNGGRDCLRWREAMQDFWRNLWLRKYPWGSLLALGFLLTAADVTQAAPLTVTDVGRIFTQAADRAALNDAQNRLDRIIDSTIGV